MAQPLSTRREVERSNVTYEPAWQYGGHEFEPARWGWNASGPSRVTSVAGGFD
jgi:hypothetical protein